jgi:hypothetical protein
MINKNAYEIRLEVLKMAKEMMDQNYNDASNAWWGLANSYAEAAKKSTAEFLKHSEDLMKAKPQMYTPQEIMEKAKELYSFIDKKDHSEDKK